MTDTFEGAETYCTLWRLKDVVKGAFAIEGEK